MKIYCICLAMVCCLLTAHKVYGQKVIVIGNIKIEGNVHTRRFVLNREMDIKTGDTIAVAEFQQALLRNENHLINTGLFATVKVAAPKWKKDDQVADISVIVNETWYLFPLPVLKLSDRNFNVWWQDFDHDFGRLIWGVRMHHFNLTGVRDYLKILAEFGWSQRYQIRYRYPYLNRDKTLGLELEASFRQSRNGAFATINNQLDFLVSEEKGNFRTLNAGVSTKYRPKYYLTHELGVRFISSSVSALVSDLNPEFFINNSSTQRYWQLIYRFRNDRRNRRFQATSGYSFDAIISKVGIGVYDDLSYGYVQAQLKKYIPIHAKVTGRISTTGRWLFERKKISYNHAQALGFGNAYVRGYEHYVIDGTDFILSHQGAAWEIYNRTINLNTFLPLKKMNVVPIRLYLSANIDVAYVNDPVYKGDHTLAKRWLYGYGPALELLLAEGYLFSVDYSLNHLGESGVFLHSKFNF